MAKVKNKGGRPPLGFVNVLARITPKQHSALKEISKETGAPMNHLIRTALDEYFWVRERSKDRPGNTHRLVRRPRPTE